MRKSLIVAALFFACLFACLSVSQNAAAQNAEPDGSGFYPLHLATRAGNIEKVKLLIKEGADVNRRQFSKYDPRGGWPPLFYALDKPETMKLLIAAGADVNVTMRGQTLISMPAKNGNAEAVKLLLSHEAEINDGDFSLALLGAIRQGHVGIAKELVEHGAKLQNAFPIAVVTGDLPLIDSILERGADPHDREAWSAAASKGRLKVLQHLIKHPERKRTFISQRTLQAALKSAVVAHQKEVADFLLKSGTHRSALEAGQREAIRRAVFTGDRELAEQVHKSYKGNIASLDIGSLAGLGLVKELRRTLSNQRHKVHTLNPNYPGIHMTPLHAAAMNGRNETVTYLLELGAGPSAPAEYGFTPLHLAVRHDHEETAKLLIEGGANIKATTVVLMGPGAFPVYMEAVSLHKLEMIATLDDLDVFAGLDRTWATDDLQGGNANHRGFATLKRLITFSRWIRAREALEKDLAETVKKEVDVHPPLWTKELDLSEEAKRTLHLFRFGTDVILILTNAENQALSSAVFKAPRFEMYYTDAHIETEIEQTDAGRLISLHFIETSIKDWSLQLRMADDELHKFQDPPPKLSESP